MEDRLCRTSKLKPSVKMKIIILILLFPSITMAGDIFLTNQNNTSNRWAILDDNGKSAWLYLSEKGSSKPYKDSFAYSPIEPVSKINLKAINKGEPPVLSKDLASKNAVIENPNQSDFTFHWSKDGESVTLLYKSQPISMIVKESKLGFSKSLKKKSPLGIPWDDKIYIKYFK